MRKGAGAINYKIQAVVEDDSFIIPCQKKKTKHVLPLTSAADRSNELPSAKISCSSHTLTCAVPASTAFASSLYLFFKKQKGIDLS